MVKLDEQVESILDLKLYSMEGREIKYNSYFLEKGKLAIYTPNLQNGSYIISVLTNKGKFTQKLFK
ncbi:MAG: T9SS type A sorting domain-containing protein, partial [Leadbetterella sp.]